MAAPVDFDVLQDFEPLTFFAWQQITPSVRAGRRFPAVRVFTGCYTTHELPVPVDVDGITIETTPRLEGEKPQPLWTLTQPMTARAGDTLRIVLG